MAGYCKNCGSPIEDGEVFCGSCGQRVKDIKPEIPAPDGENGLIGEHVTKNIFRCEDGKYRWYYEFSMLKNPTILFTVWKVLGISFGAVFLLMLLIGTCEGSTDAIWGTVKVFLILVGVFFVLSILAYFILAAVYGFKYIVLFEMDENEVSHIQCAKQVKKAEAIGWLTMLAGIAAGKPAIAGLGMNTAVRTSTTSEFANVKKVRLRPRRNVIYVSQLLNKNQVYAESEDYAFVADFIRTHCRNAKIR